MCLLRSVRIAFARVGSRKLSRLSGFHEANLRDRLSIQRMRKWKKRLFSRLSPSSSVAISIGVLGRTEVPVLIRMTISSSERSTFFTDHVPTSAKISLFCSLSQNILATLPYVVLSSLIPRREANFAVFSSVPGRTHST